MIRILAFVAVLHAALFTVGNAVSHLIHLTAKTSEVSSLHAGHHGGHHAGHHASQHQQHGKDDAQKSKTDESLASCFFCLDGVAATGGIPVDLFLSYQSGAPESAIWQAPFLRVSYASKQARAPPFSGNS